MKRAVAYARYSTDKQYDTSIEKQLEDIREYCKKKGYTIVGEYIDKAESAAKEDRPAFQRMLVDAKKGLFDVVVVHKLNRLARDRYLSVVTAHELKKYNVTVESVLEPIGEDPVGQLLWGILDAVNEFERLNTIQEVKMKMRPLALQGYWLGGRTPFGFRAVKVKDETGKTHTKLEIDEEEAKVVRRIFDLFIQGYGFKQIAEMLNREGIKKRGHKWYFSAIAEIVRNPRYAGMHFWSKGTKKNHRITREDAIFVEGPAIISKETWQKAQERLTKRTRGRERHYNYALRGIAYCECGAPLWGDKKRIHMYICKRYKEDPSKHVSISATRLEKYVKGYIRRILESDVDFERLAESINDYIRETMIGGAKSKEELVIKLQEYQQELENLTEALAKTPPVAQQAILKKINEVSAKIEETNMSLNRFETYHEITPEKLRNIYSELVKLLEEDFEVTAKRVIKKVVVYKSGYIHIEPNFSLQ